MKELPSKYQINDGFSSDTIFDGQVIAVKFTIGKVFYDVLDRLQGKIVTLDGVEMP